jgi:hypothetical protein
MPQYHRQDTNQECPMMDEELRRYLSEMEERMIGRIDARLGALLARMNDQHERLINDLNGVRRDFTDTKDFLLRDSATGTRRWLDLEERVNRLERDGKHD